MRKLLCHLMLSGFGLFGALASGASERVALVIGNSAYQVGALRNPVNDATDVAAALRKLEFDVTLSTNLDRQGMLEALDQFSNRIRPGGIAMVFYAGHGVQVDGRNWLLPVDNRRIDTQAKVRIHAVAADDILATLEGSQSSLNMLVMDACRDNPLPSAARSASRGLGMVQSGTNTLVAYSTAPGRTAADGDGRNSPYTKALLAALQADQVEVPHLFNRTGAEVLRATSKVQIPWVSNTGIDPPVVLARVTMVPVPMMDAQTGTLILDLKPADAHVWLDGALLPRGVREVPNLPPGRKALKASRDGYLDHELAVYIVAGQRTPVELALSTVESRPAKSPAPITQVPAMNGIPRKPLTVFQDRLQDGTLGPEMVVIPAGNFLMGSANDAEGAGSDEFPRHRVQLQAFAIGRTEVTFDDYDRFAHATGRALPNEFGWGRRRRPVIFVGWDDATAYAGWLSEQTGKSYRLPSEAEWEYAASAGSPGPFSFDGPISPKKANYDSNHTFGGSRKDSVGYRDRTLEVGSLPANPWGLHEVHGNVWEWTQDCWNANYDAAPIDGSARTTGDCTRRVRRGGGWDSVPRWLRAADRSFLSVANRYSSVGFRLAQD